MARRGFFAEIQRQVRVAERENQRRQRDATRHYAAVIRNLEQAQKAEERARLRLSKAEAATRKQLEKEAREAHIASMEAEVERLNAELSERCEEIESLLASTLDRDDFVDLSTLRTKVVHPPFARLDLEQPLPQPSLPPDPARPILLVPDPPRGIASIFGKRKHAEAVDVAKRRHEKALVDWQLGCRQSEERRAAAKEQYERDEQARIERLERERLRYAEECRTREEEAAAKNRELEALIANLGYGTADAVQEYVAIVLSNSVYPEHFPVTHEFSFAPETAELALRVEIPEPSQLPAVKAYKYAKSSDEIVEVALPQKECRERYASSVHQVALRSFHEVFEADRRGLIRTVSLEVGTIAIDPGTGRRGYVPLVIAAAERDSFLGLELAAVVPASALTRLGAAVSKNPFALTPVDRAGVRRA